MIGGGKDGPPFLAPIGARFGLPLFVPRHPFFFG